MARFFPSIAQLAAFVLSAVLLTVLLIIASSQFALGALIQMGVSIPFAVRLDTTLHDLANMWPLIAPIFGIGLLIAMIVAGFIARWVGILPDLVYALTGFAAVGVTIWALQALFQITAIAATRELEGVIVFCLVGGLTGYIYHRAAVRLSSTR